MTAQTFNIVAVGRIVQENGFHYLEAHRLYVRPTDLGGFLILADLEPLTKGDLAFHAPSLSVTRSRGNCLRRLFEKLCDLHAVPYSDASDDSSDARNESVMVAIDASQYEQGCREDADHHRAQLTARHGECALKVWFFPAQHSQRHELQHEAGAVEHDVEHYEAIEVETERRQPHGAKSEQGNERKRRDVDLLEDLRHEFVLRQSNRQARVGHQERQEHTRRGKHAANHNGVTDDRTCDSAADSSPRSC